jgi:hypothetical protein
VDPVFRKLNYKKQNRIWALNPPFSFRDKLASVADESEIIENKDFDGKSEFAIFFAVLKKELDELVHLVVPKLEEDAVFWVCYPKSTSKNYKCDFNRDSGWEVLGSYEMEPVRQVAIDEDWSALRFRHVKYIKNLRRREGMALSEEGKRRAVK